MKKRIMFGFAMSLGAVAGAYFAKKYYDQRKVRVEQYNTEVDRLQKEVDFDYTEDFLKELKKETLKGENKNISKDDVLNALNNARANVKAKGEELDKFIKMYMKKHGYAEDSDFEQLGFMEMENEMTTEEPVDAAEPVETITVGITVEENTEVVNETTSENEEVSEVVTEEIVEENPEN